MSAGLDASIVTPGSTAPDVSRTVPARLCALARLGAAPRRAITANNRISIRFMSETSTTACLQGDSLSRIECADYGPFRLRESRKGLQTTSAWSALRQVASRLHRWAT